MNLKLEILSELIKNNQLKEFYNLTHNYLNFINKTKEPAILNLLGIYCHKVNDFEKAENFFKDSLKVKKNNFFVLQNLCSVLLIQKKNSEGIKVLNNIIELKPEDPNAYITLAKLYDSLDHGYNGIDILKSYDLKYENIDVKYLLSLLKYKNGDYEDSIDILLNIKEEKFTNNILNLIALNYDNLLKYDLARKFYEKSLKIDPENFDTLCNFGNFERSLGNLDEARKILLKAISKYQSSCRLHRYYSISHEYKKSDDEHLALMIKTLKNLETDKKINNRNLSELYFAISKAYEDLKDLENSSKFIIKGNSSMKKNIKSSNIDFFKHHNEMLKKIFSDTAHFKNDTFEDNFNHIFVLGMPRSGTTLTEQIISAHPDTMSGGELDYFQRIIKKYYPERNSENFINHVKKDFSKDKFKIRDEYINKIQKRFSSSLTVVNKLPNNFVFIGFIKYCFPKAKIVHMNRDPRSICLSIYKNYFPDLKLWYAYDERDLVNYYNEYNNLMSFWKSLYHDYIYDVSYENLVSNPKEEIQKLLNFLNLEWNESVLKFNKKQTKISTVSTVQARQNIYSSSIKSWQRYENFLPALLSEFKNLNYNK